MSGNTSRRAGRHFLQIPGPSPVPDRILRAMDTQVIDHRGPEFQKLGRRVLEKLRGVFQTRGHVFIFPASGTGGSAVRVTGATLGTVRTRACTPCTWPMPRATSCASSRTEPVWL